MVIQTGLIGKPRAGLLFQVAFDIWERRRLGGAAARESIAREILRVAANHGAGKVLLFGSVARGEDTPESDVDLLVEVTGEVKPHHGFRGL
jgi:predicted nucleotidyltransferase